MYINKEAKCKIGKFKTFGKCEGIWKLNWYA